MMRGHGHRYHYAATWPICQARQESLWPPHGASRGATRGSHAREPGKKALSDALLQAGRQPREISKPSKGWLNYPGRSLSSAGTSIQQVVESFLPARTGGRRAPRLASSVSHHQHLTDSRLPVTAPHHAAGPALAPQRRARSECIRTGVPSLPGQVARRDNGRPRISRSGGSGRLREAETG